MARRVRRGGREDSVGRCSNCWGLDINVPSAVSGASRLSFSQRTSRRTGQNASQLLIADGMSPGKSDTEISRS